MAILNLEEFRSFSKRKLVGLRKTKWVLVRRKVIVNLAIRESAFMMSFLFVGVVLLLGVIVGVVNLLFSVDTSPVLFLIYAGAIVVVVLSRWSSPSSSIRCSPQG